MSQNQAALQGKFNIVTVISPPIIPMLLCKFKLLHYSAGISMQITTVLPGEQISFALSSPPQVTIHNGCGYQWPITRVWFSQLQDRDVSLSEKIRESKTWFPYD